jgi:hypothetical protein
MRWAILTLMRAWPEDDIEEKTFVNIHEKNVVRSSNRIPYVGVYAPYIVWWKCEYDITMVEADRA